MKTAEAASIAAAHLLCIASFFPLKSFIVVFHLASATFSFLSFLCAAESQKEANATGFQLDLLMQPPTKGDIKFREMLMILHSAGKSFQKLKPLGDVLIS